MTPGGNHDWLERERQCLPPSAHRTADPIFGPVIVKGQGSRVWDANNRDYLDLTCGYSAANFGHAFPPLIEAASQQLATLTHVTGMPHPGRAQLSERLIDVCSSAMRSDKSHWKLLFNTSGSRAVETAIKVAMHHRPGRIVSIGAAYHGRSWLTSGLSETSRIADSRTDEWLGSLVTRRPLIEFAYCAACPLQLVYPSCTLACSRTLVEWINTEQQSISAVIAEPALGARGYVLPPSEYWQTIREVTRQCGILMIADEIQMGLGRSGHWLLSAAQGWTPDLIVLGKSLGGGITPLSAVVGRQSLMDALPGGVESETFAASPLATAIGCEVINQLTHGPWMSRACELGIKLRAAFSDWVSDATVENFGASCTIEFFTRSRPLIDCQASARRLAERLVAAGLLVHYSGPYSTRVVLLPALTMTDEELTDAIKRIVASRVID